MHDGRGRLVRKAVDMEFYLWSTFRCTEVDSRGCTGTLKTTQGQYPESSV